MPAIYEHRLTVSAKEIDALGHVNNLFYLKWMLAAATGHATAQGWPTRRHLELGAGWVVRSHHIDYLQPAFVDDEVVVRTWINGFKRVSSSRRYLVTRPSDSVTLATGETNWAFVDYRRNLPVRIPKDVLDAFEIVPDGPEA